MILYIFNEILSHFLLKSNDDNNVHMIFNLRLKKLCVVSHI